MPLSPEFWSVELDVPVDLVPAAEDLLAEAGIAVSSYEVTKPGLAMSPDWRVQVLFDAPPDEKEWRKRLKQVAAGLDIPAVIRFAHLPAQDWVRHTNKLNAPVSAGRFFIYGAHDAGKGPAGPPWHPAGCRAGLRHRPRAIYFRLPAGDRRSLPRARARNMLDMGTGSGVLAMATAKAGARTVLAADIDPVATDVTRDNVKLNGLSQHIAAITASRPDDPRLKAAGPYDLVVANILAGPLCHMATGLARLVASGGHLVLSGLLTKEERLIVARYRATGLSLARRIPREGWHTLVFRRRA